MHGTLQNNDAITLPSNPGLRNSISLFSTEAHGAVIVTSWSLYLIIASTTDFDSAFKVELNTLINKWELINISGVRKIYTLFYSYYA